MINHLVFYSHRSLGIQQQAGFNNSTAHVWCVLWGVLTLHLYPIQHGQGFLPQSQLETAWKVRHNHWTTSDIGASTISIVFCISVTFLDDWMVRQSDDWSCDFIL